MAATTESIRYTDLPLVSVLDKKNMAKARALLEELDTLTTLKKENEKREAEVKAELELLQQKAGTEGLRFGGLCFTAREMAGRKTFDTGLLIENGVEPEVIEQSYKEGKSYVQRTFKKVDIG